MTASTCTDMALQNFDPYVHASIAEVKITYILLLLYYELFIALQCYNHQMTHPVNLLLYKLSRIFTVDNRDRVQR